MRDTRAVRLTGNPLENLGTVAEYVAELDPGAARNLWAQYADEDPMQVRASQEVHKTVALAYAHIGALRHVVDSPTSPISVHLWSEQQAGRLPSWSWEWPEPSPMASFRTALGYLLELEPADVTGLDEWWPDNEVARRHVGDALDAVHRQLDRLERALTGRGGWPR